MKANPAVRHVVNYRKVMTRALPSLTYLDERPIMDYERIFADAFARGGKEEEDRVRDELKAKQENEVRNRVKHYKEMEDEGKAKRKELMSKMMDVSRAKKNGKVEDYERAKEEYEKMNDNDCKKKVVLKKMHFLEDEMKEEYKQ